MKKAIALAMAMTMALSLAACGSSTPEPAETTTPADGAETEAETDTAEEGETSETPAAASGAVPELCTWKEDGPDRPDDHGRECNYRCRRRISCGLWSAGFWYLLCAVYV